MTRAPGHRRGVRWLPFTLGVHLVFSLTSSLIPAAAQSPHAQPRQAPPPTVTLYGESLTARGLLCFPLPDRPGAPASCTARSMEVRRPRLVIDGDGQGKVCVHADRALLSGVRFHAGVLRGRLLGLLPLSLPTNAVPPVPIPYLAMDRVEARGLGLTAVAVSLERARVGMTAQEPCT